MLRDHEFDPITPEEEARRYEEELFARRVRREVLRMERGEVDEEIRAEQEEEAAIRAAEQERAARTARRRSSIVWQLLSGSILVREGISRYYSHLLAAAALFFVSIAVMFWSLHLDMRYTRLERETQRLRERSIRLEEQRYRTTTYSAIVEALRSRGINLHDPKSPANLLEE